MLPTDEYYIQRLIDEGEHVHQDFKFEISDARKIAKSISAFSNTEGGRLLVGVKDNGKIAGVRSEEEIYMIEAAAKMYCTPEVNISNKIFKVQGKDILEVTIEESKNKPVYAIDMNNKAWAYVRIKDENILADTVFLNRWKYNKQDEKVIVTYSDREKHLLSILEKYGELTLNKCSKLSNIPRITTSRLLADFIRFGLVEQIFREHTFFFKLKEDTTP
ncbi:ATP-binding protein [Bacteroides caecigallinarum]|uniref:ATP-binding protein n=1 Tax=Bacteroides caecigallinarum TaxID=1411144 RepID=UPI0019583B14|nr:ATP-binding protein [Bacteroides caecigallinarum]MBM6883519.1 putative DNA binding domain-containing protein [Bacteroides caecigallinarum]MBM6890306.1 putative DNA binding domain-containing protein [Bacteroides caecigallinarum]MCF2552828.1 putative DNA binding domain-containing protein [Bacteroides caecigallinarum]